MGLSKVEKKFYNEFRPEEEELIVLVKESCGGAAVIEGFLTPSVEFIASIDSKTNELKQEDGRLEWIISGENERVGWGYNFEKMTIYKVLVRKCHEQKLMEYQSEILNRRYVVIKILEEIKSEPRLDVIREAYLKPVYIEDEKFGTFTLDRRYEWFEGELDWQGNMLEIHLDVDEDNDSTANGAFEELKKVVSDISKWNKKIREFAAKELTELANEWMEEDDDDEDENGEITEEEFAERIDICSIDFHNDGSFEITFKDDDMFWGHWVVVYVDEEGNCEDANIEG